jgi:hypothetical protein
MNWKSIIRSNPQSKLTQFSIWMIGCPNGNSRHGVLHSRIIWAFEFGDQWLMLLFRWPRKKVMSPHSTVGQKTKWGIIDGVYPLIKSGFDDV